MDISLPEDYVKNIRKLAEKNGVNYEAMLENWKMKYEEFDKITDNYGIAEEIDFFDKNEKKTIIALTINGSIIIASEPDEDGVRKVKYQSIKIRTDESKNVPEEFEDKLKNNVEINKKIIFEKTIETSIIIRMKVADNISLNNFEEKADEITYEFTKVFEDIDNKTITKKL
ncbi:MAG TPA: hypothetical protein PLE45_03305 [Spirochaetota bacterium]|nr:hypothetical protein [Spirochaetota bacterium]HOL56235.1 hypothetical protein [Spirochaetota bacterium]